METKNYVISFVLLLLLVPGLAQEPSRKAQRAKNKIEKEQLIDSLINSKTFVFVATRALPQGSGSVDLTTNSNSIEFHPERIKSYMPFFGRAYSIDYGGDGGIKFDGKPEEFKVTPLKSGKGFEVNASVSVTRDRYKLTLFISPEGNATLTITSNQRSTISYYGDIVKHEVKGENKE
jgi:hypothetical protein